MIYFAWLTFSARKKVRTDSIMPAKEFELKPASSITTGAIGPPGQRVFYLQARKEDILLTLIIEKQQMQALALGAEKFLLNLQQRFPHLAVASGQHNEESMQLQQPIDPAFRVGQIALGYDEELDLVLLVVREYASADAQIEDLAVARLWCTRTQLLAMCSLGLELAGRGRPICGNCGEPIDPQGHFCPRRNGHKH
jgi:uncharacterized repeat protein (TIGR03847 family)